MGQDEAVCLATPAESARALARQAEEARESVTNATHRLIDAWTRATAQVKRLQDDLNRASCELGNAQIALSKHLIPKGAKPGEMFNIWHGNKLLQVVADTMHPTEGEVSYRGDRA